MLSRTSLCQPSIAAAAFAAGLIIIATAPASAGARSGGLGGAIGNAVGGAVNAVGGAVKGAGDAIGSVGSTAAGALAESADNTAPAPGISPDGGASAGGTADAAGTARVGNWVGAPYIIRVRGETQESCGNALIDFLHGVKCQDGSPDGMSENLAEAAYSADSEPVVQEVALPPEEPAGETAGSKSLARLDVGQPAVEKPALGVAAKFPPPKASDKAKPQSPPLLSCGKAETIVGGYGFSALQASDCDGQVFTFKGSRDGKPFQITLNAVSGELVEVRKVSAPAAP